MKLRYEVHDSILGVIAAFPMFGDAKKWSEEYNEKVRKDSASEVVDTLAKEPTND